MAIADAATYAALDLSCGRPRRGRMVIVDAREFVLTRFRSEKRAQRVLAQLPRGVGASPAPDRLRQDSQSHQGQEPD